MTKKYVLLILIVLLAGFLRFWDLGKNPPSMTWDEAAWGYNAYSLGIDGKDEFGRLLPFNYLESFGDFKPPMYAYLDILPIKTFGLNEFGVRFPSALFGVLTVLVTYFLVRRIFWNSSARNWYAILSSLFLAISPWHIMLSRAAFEANVATFFIVAGVWLFVEAMIGKKWYLLLSVASFVFSIYTFNSARIVAPLLVVVFSIFFRKELIKNKKVSLVSLLVGIMLLFPIVGFLFSPQASLRFKEVNIFSDINIIKTTNQQIENDNNAFWSKIIHNRRFAFTIEYFKHYFDNFNPNFLFIKGDGNPKFSTQTVGQMYLWELPFFVGGILFIFRKRIGFWWIVPIWLLIGIIPAASARETPHALRIESSLPTFQILVGFGFYHFLIFLKKYISDIKKYTIIVVISCIFLFINFLYFFHDYVNHYSYEFSGEWQYGYKDSIEFVKNVQDNYDKIYITTALGRPYIYYLFYTMTNPRNFRENSLIKRDAFGFVTVENFGKYYFTDNLNNINTNNKKTLFIEAPKNTVGNASILRKFYLLNGGVSLIAYEK